MTYAIFLAGLVGKIERWVKYTHKSMDSEERSAQHMGLNSVMKNYSYTHRLGQIY